MIADTDPSERRSTRRGLLAVTGSAAAAATAGCLGSFTDASSRVQRAEDPWRDIETGTEDGTAYRRGRVVLPDGTFAVEDISVETFAIFAVEFETAGTPVDFIIFRKGEFNRYTEGDSTEYHDGSALNTVRASKQTRLDPGEYQYVFDNTVYARASPDGQVEINFTAAARGG